MSVDKSSAFINTHYLSGAQAAAASFVLGVLIKALVLLGIGVLIKALTAMLPEAVQSCIPSWGG